MTSKFMTSQPGKQAIAIAILTNISRSKGNQAMKFGQSTECKTRSIFEKKKKKKHIQNMVENDVQALF